MEGQQAGALASGPWVLVVDDNPINQEVAGAMLECLGCQVDTVGSGQEAMAALGRAEYAAIFMDCQMPGLNGFETTALIRQREAGRRRIPIIAMTAAAMREDRQRCLAAGMDDYLAKPVFMDILQGVLERWVPGAVVAG